MATDCVPPSTACLAPSNNPVRASLGGVKERKEKWEKRGVHNFSLVNTLIFQ